MFIILSLKEGYLKRTIFLLAFISCCKQVIAQTTDTAGSFSMAAYIDAYAATYTDSVGAGNFQKFPSVSPRNGMGLNTAMLSSQYNNDKVRATLVLHFGDIANSTWAANNRNIMEAHVGVRLTKKLWVDAGFFRTHFGTEFLLPVENITSSVSVNTYYEPYYESGIRLNFDPTKNLEINLFLLNGYGMYEDNNNKKSFGMGITYTVNDHCGIGYTNYIGDDSPPTNTVTHLRIHNNVFLNYQKKKIKIQLGADYCIQQNSSITDTTKSANMWCLLATIRYAATKKSGIYTRGEIFQDPNGIMTGVITDRTGVLTGYKIWGITGGIEYKPTDNSYIRLETRYLQMDNNQAIFYYNNTYRTYRYEIMVNMGVTFELINSILTKK